LGNMKMPMARTRNVRHITPRNGRRCDHRISRIGAVIVLRSFERVGSKLKPANVKREAECQSRTLGVFAGHQLPFIIRGSFTLDTVAQPDIAIADGDSLPFREGNLWSNTSTERCRLGVYSPILPMVHLVLP
jgi:hypothetical protein